MSLPRKYFSQRQEEANESFLSFDDSYESFDDDLPFAGEELPADAGQTPPTASQPYIIQLENTTTATVSNSVVLNAGDAQFGYAVAGLNITSGLTNVTYRQILSNIASGKPFRVGLLRVVASNASASLASSQVLSAMTLESKDINGNTKSMPLVPQVDPYQQQSNQVDIKVPFMVDDMTKLTIDSIYAGSTVKLYLYPEAKINKAAQLATNAKTYTNPGISPLLGKR